MCTQVNMKDFITVHHEMAHVQYFLNYKKQPKVYRDGANPGKYRLAITSFYRKHIDTYKIRKQSVEISERY